MARTLTPTINRIYKMTSFDLLRTKVQMGNMYMCVDTQVLWYDSGETADSRTVYEYVSVRNVNELLYQITPSYGKTYYCWEDNSLWVWINKWETLYSQTTYPSGYVYDDIPSIANPQDINPLYRYDMPNQPADDNGLLKDGSVVVRDRNRIIKGKITVDDGNNNLIISSFLGGGLRFLPNGGTETNGELLIDSRIANDDTVEYFATLRAQFKVLNNELYVDYSEEPTKDNNRYQKSSHLYKVYHEGNLDASGIEIMTGKQIYDKLTDDTDPDLPDLFDFNVKYLEGHRANYFAPSEHHHNASDIDGLYSMVQEQSGVAVRSIFNNMTGNGITGSYDTARQQLTLTANNFLLSFSGGATGSGTVSALSNTNIELSVDPTKHSHTNYETTMASLQRQIDDIVIDTSSTYTKNVIDQKIDAITPTATPTSGYPLKVNSQNILPATSAMAKQLDHNVTLNLTGSVTGSATFTGIENTIDIATTLDISSGTISDLVDAKLATKYYVTTIGDGVATNYTVRHNLNTQNIIVQFRDITTKQQVYLDNTIVDNNVISITSTAPISSANLQVLVYKLA